MKEIKINEKRWKYFHYLANKKKQKEKIGHAIIRFDDGFVIDVHTDLVIYDMNNEKAWKGDLV